MFGRTGFLIGLIGATLIGSSSSFADEPESKRLSPAELASKIDHFIEKRLKQEKVKPAPPASDAEFVRRIYLDMVGRIPRVSEVREFLLDKSKDKRTKLIERLLTHPLYVRHLTTTWRHIILPDTDNQQARFAAPSFENWLMNEIRNNTKYDELVRKILTPPPTNNANRQLGFISPYGNGNSPAAFYQANEYKPENLASAVTRTFLGVRLECAQCHNHPFAKYTREQFWATAAFFVNVRQATVGGTIRDPRIKPAVQQNVPKIKIPDTAQYASAKFLTDDEPLFTPNANPVQLLAAWITSPKNPYFARTGANRVWDHFFGVGLIDPVDDEPTADNPVTHPELLKLLTDQFIAHQFDLKYLLKAMAMSQTYQRTSRVTDKAQMDVRLFARMPTKAMTPEQVFDSIATATGYRETTGQTNPYVFVFGANNTPRGKFLAQFSSTENRTHRQTSILQALSMMNGQFVADATSLSRSQTLAAVVDAPFMSIGDKVETLFLAALSRSPSREESIRFTDYVKNGGPMNDSNRALTDVFWVLLNSSEFILNH